MAKLPTATKRFSFLLIPFLIAALSAGCDSTNSIATVTARANGTNTVSAILAFTVTPLPVTAGPSVVPAANVTVNATLAATASMSGTAASTLQSTTAATLAGTLSATMAGTATPAAVSATVSGTTSSTLSATLAATGAATAQPTSAAAMQATLAATMSATMAPTTAAPTQFIRNDTSWFSDATMYSLFVRSFRDSNGDGIGDLQGVIDGLDYLQKLGVNTIWLLPVFKSPSQHGYDTTDYYNVNPDYGTNDDLLRLIKEVHRRGMHILLDYVVNHTSDQHPYFKDALGNPKSQYSDYYTWFNAEHTQYDGFASLKSMPKLNFDSPKTRQFAIDIALHWLDPLGSGDLSAGVDGYRCDVAIGPPHDFWAQLRTAMTAKNPQSLLLGEIWVSSPKTIADYLQGDQFNAAFDFPLYGILAGQPEKDGDGALSGKGAIGLVAGSIRATDRFYKPDAHLVRFINNHDTNRVMSDVLLNLDRARAAAVLELTIPSVPIIYYGEEIGMKGDKGGPPDYDNYRREPLDWYAAMTGAGQTTWFTKADQNNKPNDGVSIEEESGKPESLLTLYQTLGQLRQTHAVLRTGRYDLPQLSGAQKDLYVLRRWNGGEMYVVVINFSEKLITWTPDDATWSADGIHYQLPSNRASSQNVTLDGPNWTLGAAGYIILRAVAPF